MFKNFLKITLRNINRHKGYSFINITGLAIGMACSLLISLWVLDELSYDRFHKNADQLYRVEENQHYTGRLFHVVVTPYPIAPALVDEVPEIVAATRYVYPGTLLFKYKEKAFIERDVRSVDPSFLTMFSFPLIKGDRETALSDPQSVVISERIAEKYFGTEDPMGKVFNISNSLDFKVAGVMKNVPHNSTLRFEILFPYEFLRRIGRTNDHWGANSIQTFVQLSASASLDEANRKIFGFIRTRLKESKTDLELMPFTRLHLHAWSGYVKQAGAIQYVYIFSIIAIFVLLIACINFMNLATARSASRAREVGMRKVVGAMKSHLIRQFYGESVVFALIAMVLAVIIVRLFLPIFSTFAEKEITFGVAGFSMILLFLLGITLFSGVVAGSYPALFLSSFKPVNVLKGTYSSGRSGARFRQILVVFQFVLSVFLIIGSVVVYKQLSHMRNKNPGYERDNLVYLVLRRGIKPSYQVLKNELKGQPGILNVTGTQALPSMIGSNSAGADWDGKDPDFRILISQSAVDHDFVKTMGINLVEGRDFSTEFGGDSGKNFLVNEETAKLMNKERVVGERFEFIGLKGQIVGVMKNFHFQSLRNKVEPLAVYLLPKNVNYLIIRVAGKDIPGTMATIEKTFRRIIPNYPFEARFYDEDFDRMYRSEQKISTVVKYFTYLTIIIACLGLFGLASFSAEQRTKEIGIRKVLGASVTRVTLLLCREFFVLVTIATICAFPLAYYAMSQWLQSYYYRISLGVAVFLTAAGLTLMIAIFSVSFQAIKAALGNPVEALKYE